MFDQCRIAGVDLRVCVRFRVPSASYFRARRFQSKHFISPLTESERERERERERVRGEEESLASREENEKTATLVP